VINLHVIEMFYCAVYLRRVTIVRLIE